MLEGEAVEELVEEWSRRCARRIRQRRKDLGFTQQQVADLAGTSIQTVSRAEYDAATIRDDARLRISVALGSEVSVLWEPLASEEARRRAKAVA